MKAVSNAPSQFVIKSSQINNVVEQTVYQTISPKNYTTAHSTNICPLSFIQVLIPIWKEDIPRLYPGEENKVILHMDGARAHFHPNVVQWLETKIKYTPAGHWPANSPDLSPMDYGINGIFKNLCNRRAATTKSELMKVAKEV